MKRRRRKAPVSTLRARLSERVRDKDVWDREGVEDFTRHDPEPFFLLSLLRQTHRYLPVKITVALAVVLLTVLLCRGDYPWGRPFVDALRFATGRNIEWNAVQEVIPAFRTTWENWNLPAFLPGEEKEQPEGWKLPLDGMLTGAYGLRDQDRMHYGIDLAAPAGTPVKAVLDGRVTAINRNEATVTIVIDHHRGWQTLYGGLTSVAVKEGDTITQGGVLGLLGPDAHSGSPCLYFELRWGGRPVAPPGQWVAQFEERPL